MFTSYNRLITFSCFLFVFCSSTSAVFTVVLIMSSMIPLTILSLDTDETVRNLSIEFYVALLRLFMFMLIFYEQRVPKFTFVLVLTYYVNRIYFYIDRDWMIYRKHPIRSLLTSMLRKASIQYPSDVYALSFEKYKGK